MCSALTSGSDAIVYTLDNLCCCHGLLRNVGYLLTYCFNDNVICLHTEFNKFNKNTSMILLNLSSNSVNKITIDAIQHIASDV